MERIPYLRTISRNIEVLRTERGWSQGELARKAGVSQKVISNIENAEDRNIHPTINTISAIADALGVSTLLLLTPLPLEQLESLKEESAAKAISRLVESYVSLPLAGRRTVERVLDLEVRAG